MPRTCRAALAVTALTVALVAVPNAAGASAPKPAAPTIQASEDACFWFRYYWGPHYTYPGLNCP